jgi:peptidoglycan/xylan/chitin deacetylase (PgdA/CDA1 family)
MKTTSRICLVVFLLYQLFLAFVYAESDAAFTPHEPVILLSNSSITVTLDANHAPLALPLDDQDSTITPGTSNGSIMVPLRFIAEHFGAKVLYHEDQSIDVQWKDRTLKLALNNSTITVDHDLIYMSAQSVLANNSTYVPLKDIIEALGEHVIILPNAIYVGDLTDADTMQQQITEALPLLKKGMPYLVYQGSSFLDGFAGKSEAVAYAKLWADSSVLTRSGDAVWDTSMMKPVYLSFDDGPNEYTPAILDILASYGIKATFFMLGPHIDQYPSTVKRMINEGHAVGLHGVTHNHTLIYRTPQTVVNEMNNCNVSLKKAAGVGTNLIRVPYGSMPYMKQDYRNAVVQAGYRMWDWNVDSTDSLGAGTDTIIKKTIEQVSTKDSAIILFHDKKTTLQALPAVIDYLIQHGYHFKTMDSSMPPVNFWKDTR